MLTENELSHLAKLSKLHLDSQEQQSLQKGLESIVEFLGQLNEIEDIDTDLFEEEASIAPFVEQESYLDPQSLTYNSNHKK